MQDAEETPEGESAQDFESEPGQGYLLELHFELDGRASTMRDKALRAHFMAELDAAGVLMSAASPATLTFFNPLLRPLLFVAMSRTLRRAASQFLSVIPAVADCLILRD